MSGIIVDIGTGDGKFTYKIAKENPDRFVIGIDPSHKSLEKTSGKIYKKEVKGGLKNALFVLANIEDLPDELEGAANQVFINFPWGSLLKGIVLVEDKTWNNIKKICQKGAIIDIVLGYDVNYEQGKSRELDLPDLDLEYIEKKLIPKLSEKGFKTIERREIDKEDLKDYPSGWAKRLAYGRENRKIYFLRLKIGR